MPAITAHLIYAIKRDHRGAQQGGLYRDRTTGAAPASAQARTVPGLPLSVGRYTPETGSLKFDHIAPVHGGTAKMNFGASVLADLADVANLLGRIDQYWKNVPGNSHLRLNGRKAIVELPCGIVILGRNSARLADGESGALADGRYKWPRFRDVRRIRCSKGKIHSRRRGPAACSGTCLPPCPNMRRDQIELQESFNP